MCGINGIYLSKINNTSISLENTIKRMNNAILRRGKDSEGSYINERVALGMRRLAIIDVLNGDQPITNDTGELIIVYNGEVYNFQDIRKDLIVRGHHFQTNTDTEVVLKAYESFGVDCLNLFDGMFSFAIFNQRDHTLFLARDKMGVKPLCYAYNQDEFVFSSTVDGIAATNLFSRQIDWSSFLQYLQLSYIPSPYTIFKEVHKLPAGCYLYLKPNELPQICKYADPFPGENDFLQDYDECKRLLRDALYRSVERRLIADGHVGAFLSGGIDSTIITGIMSELTSHSVDTFTIGYNDREYDESNRAICASNYHHTNHHVLMLDYDEAISSIDSILSAYDEPYADSSAIPSYFVSRLASSYVKVVLTGDAGDELFGGYSKYLVGHYADIYNKIPFACRYLFEHLLPFIPDRSFLSRKIRKVIHNAQCSPFMRRRNMMCQGFKDEELPLLINNSRSAVSSLGFIESIYNRLPADSEEMDRVFYTDWKVVLEGDMHVKMDRVSLLHSVETRAPFMGADVLDLSCRIPIKYKIQGANLKVILRETFEDKIPSPLRKAVKKGFSIPLDRWFRYEMKNDLEANFARDFIEDQGIFNYSFIKQLLDDHQSCKKNRKNELWVLYAFQKWYKRYWG